MKEYNSGAAYKLRRGVDAAGTGVCNQCMVIFDAVDLEVDHIRPIADGGLDTDRNTQLLCVQHHLEKTTAESRQRIKLAANAIQLAINADQKR